MIQDPGSNIRDGGKSRSGINIPDLQHCSEAISSDKSQKGNTPGGMFRNS